MLYKRWRKALRRRLAGAAFKPPCGASKATMRLLSSQGKGFVRGQVRVKEMNESEPLKKCRESVPIAKTITILRVMGGV